MLPSLWIALICAAVLSLVVWYGMVRASHRSALWNIAAGALAVFAVGTALALTAVLLTRWAFG